MARGRNRSSGEIDKLPGDLKDTVEQMLLGGDTYREIVEYLSRQGVVLSQMSVCRYAKKYLATVEQLQLSQENMRMIMNEVEKYPNLDTTEAILRLSSQNVLNAITAMPQEAWETINPEKLLNQANALVRAAGYKKRIDLQNKSDTEAALEANQALLTDVLAKKHPELYKQVMSALKQEKEQIQEASS